MAATYLSRFYKLHPKPAAVGKRLQDILKYASGLVLRQNTVLCSVSFAKNEAIDRRAKEVGTLTDKQRRTRAMKIGYPATSAVLNDPQRVFAIILGNLWREKYDFPQHMHLTNGLPYSTRKVLQKEQADYIQHFHPAPSIPAPLAKSDENEVINEFDKYHTKLLGLESADLDDEIDRRCEEIKTLTDGR